MCYQITCPTCSKTSWQGCGSHVPAVMDAIPLEKRCSCQPQVEKGGKMYPPRGGKGKGDGDGDGSSWQLMGAGAVAVAVGGLAWLVGRR